MVFCFSKRDLSATLSALESLYDLFLYNRSNCLLKRPLQVRFAVHSGVCRFITTCKKGEVPFRVKIVAVIQDPEEIRKILRHLIKVGRPISILLP